MQMPLDELQTTLTQLDGLHLVGQQANSSHDSTEAHDLIESAPSGGGDNPFDLCLEGERKAQLIEAVSRMSEREQLILSLYYREELTMKEVSKVVGIAVSRVSQIHAAAMVKLRASLKHLHAGAAEPAHRRPTASQTANGQQFRGQA
jgi:RNA polymerase sigma factor for flagellar operon FliA